MADLVDRGDPIEEVVGLFERYGSSPYDEAVSMTEHCVQTAVGALDNDAPESLVAAALLHDIGHLLLARDRGDDDFLQPDWDHERAGADWLRPRFGDAVAEPVALHVEAKRYLCHREPTYADSLSPASIASLAVQGGPHDEAAAAAFEANPWAAAAVALRRWDDDGKVAGRTIPSLPDFEPLLRSIRR